MRLEQGISVIMPTYNQGAFICRAIRSIINQTYKNWELIIINDGSRDYTREAIKEYLDDNRISYYENEQNEGLGAALNQGITFSKHTLIAYLPSDDIYYSTHLMDLYDKIRLCKDAILVYSIMKYEYIDGVINSKSKRHGGEDESLPLQLVQVLHRKLGIKWVERTQLVTDDLNRMYWSQLAKEGRFVSTEKLTCEWVNHPNQRHKIINELSGGGIYSYKRYYNVTKEIMFQSTAGNSIDESHLYRNFKTKVSSNLTSGLKILLVGELSYNAERICAFEEYGHELYGIWMNSPKFYNAVGPFPFANVKQLSYQNWINEIREIKPDIIYGLLNYPAVPFVHHIMMNNPGVPFVWHFKESPFFCRQSGTWNQLVELYANADGKIYNNPEMKEWFSQFISEEEGESMILDGDLPKKDYFTDQRSPLLSESDGDIHTVVPGRPLGLLPEHLLELSQQKIHLHFYGNIQQEIWRDWIELSWKLASKYLHIHPYCEPENWVKEFSQYDAGWLHYFESENMGEIIRAEWNDLNYPSRMATLAAAGVPMIQKNNCSHIVATQNLSKKMKTGVFFDTFEELGGILRNKKLMNKIEENVWKSRNIFTFDFHVGELTKFFRQIISMYRS